MKFHASLLLLWAAPVFALGQIQSPAGTAPGVPAQTAAVVPTVVLPTPTPTVDVANSPKIFFRKPTFDFGNMDEGPDIVHEFHFRNKGKSTLKISNVGTSCGCTAAVEDKKEILPGGLGVIKATYHTSGRPGHATKFITVTSNDPANPSFQLKLDMTVVREIDSQPDRVYLYGVQYKTPRTSDIKVLGKPGVHLEILSAESSSKVVTVTAVAPVTEDAPAAAPVSGVAPPKQKKRTGATISISLPATQPIGSFTDEIVIKTNSLKKPEVRIPILGEVVGRVQFNPKSLYFMPHQDAPVTVQFTVTDRPKDFAIRKVESAKHLVRPYVKKIQVPGGPDQYVLIASVMKNLPKDSDGKDQLIVYTNDDLQPKISIDVSASK